MSGLNVWYLLYDDDDDDNWRVGPDVVKNSGYTQRTLSDKDSASSWSTDCFLVLDKNATYLYQPRSLSSSPSVWPGQNLKKLTSQND